MTSHNQLRMRNNCFHMFGFFWHDFFCFWLLLCEEEDYNVDDNDSLDSGSRKICWIWANHHFYSLIQGFLTLNCGPIVFPNILQVAHFFKIWANRFFFTHSGFSNQGLQTIWVHKHFSVSTWYPSKFARLQKNPFFAPIGFHIYPPRQWFSTGCRGTLGCREKY